MRGFESGRGGPGWRHQDERGRPRTPGRRTLTGGLRRRSLRPARGGSATPPVRPRRAGESDGIPAEETGDFIAKGMVSANEHKGPDHGIWYAGEYKSAFPERWRDEYRDGYADPEYWERVEGKRLTWRLRAGKSATEGIARWVAGLTIAECVTTVRALEAEAVAAAVGAAKFDERFGSPYREVPEEERLVIGLAAGGFQREFVARTETARRGEVGTMGNRSAKRGDWYYIDNHPLYLWKHPRGAFQGENVIYLGRSEDGEQLWSGLGFKEVTERALLQSMVSDYNRDRDARDLAYLQALRSEEGELPDGFREGDFPETITVEDILDAEPARTPSGRIRRGGFRVDQGRALDLDRVKDWKEET